jgi:catechol 2,3-dioxygenase-like lactoylglutathione lyase family enzyme
MTVRFLGVSPMIPARDVDEAIAFYCDSLGFTLDYRDGEPAQFAIVARDAARLNLFFNQDKYLAGQTSLRIGVDGIEELYARCREAGCVHPNGALGVKPWGTTEFGVLDPSGVCISFVQEGQ